MGETNITISKKKSDYLQFITALLHDMEALEIMVNNKHFEDDKQRIGAEQELCIVNTDWKPADNSLEILNEINDSTAFTTELAKFNIEINLVPIELKPGCFTALEADLLAKMERAHTAAQLFNSKLVLAGILPTISRNEMTLDYLTPLERYFQLSKKLRNLRGRKFDLYLKGVDELHIRHDSIMFEACNTSFQTHLQINPKDFVSSYNWASAISAPVLAATSNSPLLLGKELWSEIRIALFQQSIDTRQSMDEIREQSPRVTFGKDWIYNSITEIYREDITRFEVLMPDVIEDNALDNLKNNIVPTLRALRLHNGTIYRWNRMCYGITDNKPHLRIENRYLPAGPTIKDEIANMAFWIGLMKGMPENAKTIWEHFDFRDVKANFFKAARTGIESVFIWRDKEISARELILNELLPLAAEGLKKSGITDEEIFLYLGVIEKRIKTNTGAQWQIKNFRKLKKEMNTPDALKVLTENMYNNQRKNIPVCAWEGIDIASSVKEQIGNMTLIKQLMSTEVFTVYPDDPVALVKNIMVWNKINHVVIENKKGVILGIVTTGHLKELGENLDGGDAIPVKKLMRKEILTIAPDAKIEDALKIMQENWISSLPVVQDNELIGMITKNDMMRWLALKQP